MNVAEIVRTLEAKQLTSALTRIRCGKCESTYFARGPVLGGMWLRNHECEVTP